ncbi:MAG: nuclear transport factor 2 family protein [Gammaproteobacteria bacterium]|nr:nuclear transport factor 2 family protein [Gammaproteobacteria bacterium]
MNASEHKQIIKNNFEQLAKGNGEPLLQSLADSVQWTIIGTTVLSKTFNGKQAVIDQLLLPFREALVDGHIHIRVDNLLADGDYVVAQGQGEAMTKRGVPYNNTYCWVYKFVNGKIAALTEYLDTELVTRAFG